MLTWQKRARWVLWPPRPASSRWCMRPRAIVRRRVRLNRYRASIPLQSLRAGRVRRADEGRARNGPHRCRKAARYPDGSTRLLGVKVTSVRQGKTFIATGEEARVGEDQTNLDMKGNVRMKSSDGLEVSADSAKYSQSEGIVRAPGPVTFKRGRMSGSGVDFSYDEARDLLGLSDQTRVKIAPSKRGGEQRISNRAPRCSRVRTSSSRSSARCTSSAAHR